MGQQLNPSEISVAVITVSDRSHRGEREDGSGPAAISSLAAAGFGRAQGSVIPDGRESVAAAISSAIEDEADLVLTVGGTGVGPRDETPEGTKPLLEKEIQGIAEGLRQFGAEHVPTAWFSRGLVGVSRPGSSGHQAVVVNLAGSPGAAKDGVEFLAPLLPHLIDHLRGGDH